MRASIDRIGLRGILYHSCIRAMQEEHTSGSGVGRVVYVRRMGCPDALKMQSKYVF